MCGMPVVIHDLEGVLVRFLPLARTWHEHPACVAAKRHGQDQACVTFEMSRLADACRNHPRGLVKVCHAGLRELALPRYAGDGRLRWMLFAGPWGDDGRRADLRDVPGPVATGSGLAALNAQREVDLLESLRQLSARLAEWVETARLAHLGDAQHSRREEVLRFLRRHYGTDVGLTDLATHLGLSPSRTTHEVTRLFGASFITLLVQARLDAAVCLLRQSPLSVAEVAQRCGFRDPSNFNKAFRARFGTTPSSLRRSPGP